MVREEREEGRGGVGGLGVRVGGVRRGPQGARRAGWFSVQLVMKELLPGCVRCVCVTSAAGPCSSTSPTGIMHIVGQCTEATRVPPYRAS